MPKRKPAKRAIPKPKKVGRKSGDKAPAKEIQPDHKALRRMLYDALCKRIEKGELRKSADIKRWRELKDEIERDETGAEPETDIVESGVEAAIYCGTSQRVITDHVQKGKLKRNKDGTYHKAELNRWIERYGKKEPAGEGDKTLKTKIDEAELRYRLAKARKEERLADEADGLVVKWEDVKAQWGERIVIVKSSLEKWGDRLPALLVGRTRESIQGVLNTEIEELLCAFESAGRYCPECKRKRSKADAHTTRK